MASKSLCEVSSEESSLRSGERDALSDAADAKAPPPGSTSMREIEAEAEAEAEALFSQMPDAEWHEGTSEAARLAAPSSAEAAEVPSVVFGWSAAGEVAAGASALLAAPALTASSAAAVDNAADAGAAPSAWPASCPRSAASCRLRVSISSR